LEDCSKADAKVQVKGSDPILEGELFNDIAKDDSSWTIGKTLSSADSRAGIHTDWKTMVS
jgi:hypothetical protein